jgi:hypothetical protein
MGVAWCGAAADTMPAGGLMAGILSTITGRAPCVPANDGRAELVHALLLSRRCNCMLPSSGTRNLNAVSVCVPSNHLCPGSRALHTF